MQDPLVPLADLINVCKNKHIIMFRLCSRDLFSTCSCQQANSVSANDSAEPAVLAKTINNNVNNNANTRCVDFTSSTE